MFYVIGSCYTHWEADRVHVSEFRRRPQRRLFWGCSARLASTSHSTPSRFHSTPSVESTVMFSFEKMLFYIHVLFLQPWSSIVLAIACNALLSILLTRSVWLCSDANILRLEETRRARVPHSFRQDMWFAPQLEWQSFNLAFTLYCRKWNKYLELNIESCTFIWFHIWTFPSCLWFVYEKLSRFSSRVFHISKFAILFIINLHEM